MEDKKIRANFVFQMLGRPPEHLIDTMNSLIDSISAEKGIKIIERMVHPAKKVDNKDERGQPIAQGELYSTFSDIELELDNLMTLLSIAIRYMPSHIEIIYPEDFNLKNVDFNLIVNEILARLHNYDAIAKSSLMNNQLLAKKLSEIMEQNNKPGAIVKQPAPLEISYGKKEEKHKERGKDRPKNKKSKK